MSEELDLEGKRFGRFVVIRLERTIAHPSGARSKMWLCQCDCGQTKEVRQGNLKSGAIKSCGCLRRDFAINNHLRHGATGSPEYKAWSGIKRRCFNNSHPYFKDWGGRGITMCDRWRDSFENFIADMGPRPSPDHSIDRIDNDGNYEPGNCRWATRKEQQSNRRGVMLISYKGEVASAAEWARRSKISARTIRDRIKRGWPEEKAINSPLRI